MISSIGGGLTSFGLAGSARYLISPMMAGLLLAISDIKLLLIIDIWTFIITVATTTIVKRGLVSKKLTSRIPSLTALRRLESNNRETRRPCSDSYVQHRDLLYGNFSDFGRADGARFY